MDSIGVGAAATMDAPTPDLDLAFEICRSAAELWYLDEVERITSAQRRLLMGQTTGEGESAFIGEAKRREKARLNALLDCSPHAPVGSAALEAPALLARLESAERVAGQYRDELIPKAGRAVETARERLALGLGNLRDFLETEGAWYDLSLEGARAQADCTMLRAQLETLAGLRRYSGISTRADGSRGLRRMASEKR